MSHIAWKLASAGAGMAASFVAGKAISAVWKAATGHTPPEDAADPANPLAEAVVYAVVSGALIGVAQVFATRGAAKIYAKRVQGPLPWEREIEV